MGVRLRGVFAVASALSVVLHAQDAPRQPPTFRTEANYVRVDVYPTLNDAPIADLRQDDFEILDNGVPQKIDQFEHVQIRAAGPQDTRLEPNTIRQSREMLQEPRARVFVIFLDVYHVEIEGSHDIRAALVKALDRLIGPDDLVGVMTPEMAPSDIAFARKTTTIDGFLTRYWYWGERGRIIQPDQKDQDYAACYPGIRSIQCPDGTSDNDAGIADAMVQRRHEYVTLGALEGLVAYLRGVREERKAILTISDGWLRYRPDLNLARRLSCQAPSPPPIGVDPRGGKLSMKAPPGQFTSTAHDCDADRMQLANIDDDLDFRRMLDEANRANASFYTIDPRGLAVFDTPIAPVSVTGAILPAVPPSVDQHLLEARQMSLRTLADSTDGLAMLNSNDFDKSFSRIINDVTSYYLLGYYTTAPLDGKFHSITVRVKRPGVRVRARRGYLAPTAAEMTRAAAPKAPPSPAEMNAVAEARAIDAVIAPLATYERELPMRLHTAATGTKVWVEGELGPTAVRTDWKDGGTVDLLLTNGTGETVGGSRATIPAGGRTFEAAIPAPGAGDYEVRIRARPATGDGLTLTETTKVAAGTPRFIRRGPTTGNREAPAADLRFRRSETLRVEWPAEGGSAGEGHLLDRTGKPLPIPVAVDTRTADGTEWHGAQVTLAPLAPGDYVIELQEGSTRRLAAFRLVP